MENNKTKKVEKLPEISRIMFIGFDETFNGKILEESSNEEAIVEISSKNLDNEEH